MVEIPAEDIGRDGGLLYGGRHCWILDLCI